MKILLSFLAITIFASFTVMGQSTIEKRKYRSGFYFSPIISHRHLHHQQANIPSIEKKANINKTDILSVNKKILIVDTSDLTFQNKVIQLGINNTNKPTDTVSIAPVKEKLNKTSLLDRMSGNMNEPYAAKSSLLELSSQRSFDLRLGSKDNGCGIILFKLAILLIAVLIGSAFPALSPRVDCLLAMLVIILAAGMVHLFKNG
jgi:hypothetical protein